MPTTRRRNCAAQKRWRRYTYDDLIARDKVNLDITWLRDESLEDGSNLPAPDILAQESADDLRGALEEFEALAADLAASRAAWSVRKIAKA